MKKIWFLRALEISLLLFIALFFITASIQAQGYRDFPYNYDDFYTFDSWGPSFLMNFQNNYGYGQGNLGAWPQSNISSIYPGRGSASYNFPDIQPSYGLGYGGWASASYGPPYGPPNGPPQFIMGFSGLPNLNLIPYDPSTERYQTQFGNIQSGGFTNSNNWRLVLPPFGPAPLLSVGGHWSGDNTEIITQDDDGETLTFHIGDQIEVILPVDESIPFLDSPEDLGCGWHYDFDILNTNVIMPAGGDTKKKDKQISLYYTVGIGVTELILYYSSTNYREEIEDTFSVTIVVAD